MFEIPSEDVGNGTYHRFASVITRQNLTMITIIVVSHCKLNLQIIAGKLQEIALWVKLPTVKWNLPFKSFIWQKLE